MSNLILYGAQNLNNKKCVISNPEGFRSNQSSIQTIKNARFDGATVVDRKLDEKDITLDGVLYATDDLTLEEVLHEYNTALQDKNRYFRVSPTWLEFTPLASSEGWQVVGDATALDFDEEVFQYGEGSVSFNIDLDGAFYYSGVKTESGQYHNMASFAGTGNFEIWVYLPSTKGLSGVTLRVGGDASNYYYSTQTSQYDGSVFQPGWNYCSFRVAQMTQEGIPDPYGMGEYIEMRIIYGTEMAETEELRFGGLIWQKDNASRNYKAYVGGIEVSTNHYDITRASCTIGVLAYEGAAMSTGEFNAYGSAGNETATTTATAIFQGSHTPLPVITFNVRAATNVSGITLTNFTTGDSVTVEATYAAADVMVIDCLTREVTLNGIAVDYDDVLPRFLLGDNSLQFSIQTTDEEDIEETTQNINLTGEV
jgi:hypothetical protein